jgi:hypothetical protein
MATLPNYVSSSEIRSYSVSTREERESSPVAGRLRAEADPFLLRPLPGEDVFFFAKRIDNSRVVRQADPRAAGATCVLAALLTGALVPRVANLLAGYKLEALRQEQQKLIDERMVLEVEEARLLSPARLDELAHRQNLVVPKSDQLIDLESKGDGALASLQREAR